MPRTIISTPNAPQGHRHLLPGRESRHDRVRVRPDPARSRDRRAGAGRRWKRRSGACSTISRPSSTRPAAASRRSSKLNVFLTRPRATSRTLNKVMAEYFSEPYPARADGAGRRAAEGRARRDRLRRRAAELAARSDCTADASHSHAAPRARRSSRRSCAPSRRCAASASALAGKLAKLGITTVQDLLFLLPLRYEDRTRVVPIGSLQVGERAVVEGEVQLARSRVSRPTPAAVPHRRRLGLADAALLSLLAARSNRASRAARACAASARFAAGPAASRSCIPSIGASPARRGATEETLTPIYPLTEGVQQGRLRQLTGAGAARALRSARFAIGCRPRCCSALNLPPLRDALEYVHRPPPDADSELLATGRHPAQRRLAFEELLAHQLSLRLLRREIQRDPGWAFAAGDAQSLVARFCRLAAVRADAVRSSARGSEIERDLAQSQSDAATGARRRRLRQDGRRRARGGARGRSRLSGRGDGADGTARGAARAQFRRAGSRRSICALTLLTGKRTAAARTRALADLASGAAQIAIGTHALFQEGVEFQRLGLAIVDEQHRFGVHQRLLLREKGAASAAIRISSS